MEHDGFIDSNAASNRGGKTGGRKFCVIGFVIGLLVGIGILCGVYFGVPRIQNVDESIDDAHTPSVTLSYGEYESAAVAADVPECSKIGTEMLKKGGHAVDAAIAGMLCVSIFSCHSAGIGGGAFITVYDAPTDEVIFINAREVAPIASDKDMYVKNSASSKIGGLSIAIPGEIAGYWEAHQRFGKLEWSELFEPVIKLASEGAKVGKALDPVIKRKENDIRNESLNLGPLFLAADGSLKTEGDIIVFPQLAQTFKKIAMEGANEFYNGSLAQQIVDDIEDAFGNSIITLEDLSRYRAEVREALSIDLNNEYTVYSPPPTGSGAVLSVILNVLEHYNFTPESLTKDEITKTYHRIIEAFKFAYAKRSQLGDDRFNKNITQLVNKMISEKFAREIFANITDDRTHDISYYGAKYAAPPNDSGTSHISVIAEDGSAVSMTSTINLYFGSKVRGYRTGIIFNNEMDDFSTPNLINFFGVPPSPANFIEPGKRPLSSMTPTILLKKGETDPKRKVKMITGAAGGTMITTGTALSIIDHLWFGEKLNESVSKLRIHHQLAPNEVRYEVGFEQSVIDGLVNKGHEVKSYNPPGSVVQAIARLSNGKIMAVSDERKKGAPDGY